MTLTLTADDGTQTPLKAKPSSMHAETLDDGQVKVTLAWATDDLAARSPSPVTTPPSSRRRIPETRANPSRPRAKPSSRATCPRSPCATSPSASAP